MVICLLDPRRKSNVNITICARIRVMDRVFKLNYGAYLPVYILLIPHGEKPKKNQMSEAL